MIMILENTQRSNPKDDGIFLLDSEKPTTPTTSDNSTTILVVAIGAAVIAIGAAVYIGKLLYKRSKRKKDFEDDITEVISISPPPKKTAADHLEGIKEITQKALQPLKLGNPSTLLLSESRGSSPPTSSKFQAERSLRNPLLQSRTPPPPPSSPPPPPSPLKFRYEEDFEIDPIRLSLLDALLLDFLTSTQTTQTPSSASHRSSRSTSIANSRTLSQQPSLPQLRPPRDRLNPKRSKQNIIKYDDYANFLSIQDKDIEDIKVIPSERITPAETEVHSSNSS